VILSRKRLRIKRLADDQVLAKHRFVEAAVLFTLARDHVELVVIHPAGARSEPDPQPNRVDNGPSVLGWRSAW
jgi:hypothetical protein